MATNQKPTKPSAPSVQKPALLQKPVVPKPANQRNSKLTILGNQRSELELKMLSTKALSWIQGKINAIKKTSGIAADISKEVSRQRGKTLKYRDRGHMYFFYYDAKLKAELPYWDKFPLVLVLELYDDGFLGLNLHYLPVKYRIAFLKKLAKTYAIKNHEQTVVSKNGEIERLRVTYEILKMTKNLQEFRPCIKRYLGAHIKSPLLEVAPNEWDIAITLPIQQFQKKKAPEVWKDSMDHWKDHMAHFNQD